jgi:hypothetical protein
VRDALGILGEAFIWAGVEGSDRGRWSAEQKPAVVHYQEETSYRKGNRGGSAA